MIPRMLEKYKNEISPALLKEFGYKNVMQLPRIQKVVVNIGVGDAKLDIKFMDAAIAELRAITGQQPLLKRAKKSIAGFKVRQGMPVACSVTLRGNKMWEFLDRLINVALPRVKDFRGVNPNAFDGRGNYSLGIKEQIIFPEIDFDKIERVSGMNIAIVTTCNTDQEAKSLLAKLGMPFRK